MASIIRKAQPECRDQQDPHHRIKKGYKPAGSDRLQPGGGSTPAAAAPAAVRGPLQPDGVISLPELGNLRMHRPARDLPLGAGHEQAERTVDPLPASSTKINSDDRKKLRQAHKHPRLDSSYKTIEQTHRSSFTV